MKKSLLQGITAVSLVLSLGLCVFYPVTHANASDYVKQKVAGGTDHTVIVKADGTLWAFGKNDRGQIGDGTTLERRAAVQIGTSNDWVAVAAGAAHSIALKTNGTIWAWGDNDYGQAGHPLALFLTAPTQVVRSGPVAVNDDWVAIAAGDHHSVALRTDGTLWVWGRDNFGQLGITGDADRHSPVKLGTDTDWASIAAGSDHTLGLKAGGTLWAWGLNVWGQLGDGTTTERTSPVQVLIPGGSGLFDEDWVAVDAGRFHTLALKSNGTLWAWGSDVWGQTGTNGADSCFIGPDCRKSPVRIGSTPSGPGTENSWTWFAAGDFHTLALKSDGSLWSWGRNDAGQVGDGTTIQRNVPVRIGADSDWTSVEAGGSHSIATKSRGTLLAWGSNVFGQLGDGTAETERLAPVSIGEDSNRWVKVSSEDSYTLAVRSDGTLWGWGRNTFGQLGDGTTTDRDFPDQIGADRDWAAVAAGTTHAIALKSNGTLYGWGRNTFGQLGDSTNVDKSSPVRIGTDNDWTKIAVGSGHTVALKSDGTLWTWGWNSGGQLGDGSTIDTNFPARIGAASDWVSIAASNGHNLALKSDGSLWGWGDNDLGSLGDGTLDWALSPIRIGTDNDWASVSTGSTHTLALKATGTIWAWGSNAGGELGTGSTSAFRAVPGQVGTDNDWVVILAGNSASAAIKSDGSRSAWGRNSFGSLGDGTTADRYSPVRVGENNNWVSLEAGGSYTLALRSDGTLWYSGRNLYGQFGDGTSDNSLVPTPGGLFTFADAGPDQFVSYEDMVTLDASGSRTVVDGELEYQWYCVQGCDDDCLVKERHLGPIPPTERVMINVPDGAPAWERGGVSPNFPAPERVGSIILQLRVTDAFGSSDTDEVAVTVFEDVEHAVFVATDGDDDSPGMLSDPLADIEVAFDRANWFRQCADSGAACAQDNDCSPGVKCLRADIYVQEGEYMAIDTLEVREHMSVYGGFAGDWTRTATLPSRIHGASTALHVAGVLRPTNIDGLHIESRDGESHAFYDFGENSTAIYIANSNGNLTIANNLIEAGMGGASGLPPEYDETAEDGQPGDAGEDATTLLGPVVDVADGGSGGRGDAAGWDGGDGGACGHDCVYAVDLVACGADDGQDGLGGSLGGGGGEACSDGEDGAHGSDGAGGHGGEWAAPEGEIVNFGIPEWRGLQGGRGGGGSAGGGGGGGAAGDGDWAAIPFIFPPIPAAATYPGGGGGGGGEGGRGGDGGYAGLSGGASFGVFMASASPSLRHNQFITAGGGAGGPGGDGQLGGLGGPGGRGGFSDPFEDGSSDGAQGGDGGRGGQGGGGGGGAGGPSYGVYVALNSSPGLISNCYASESCTVSLTDGGIGAGGIGGAGGFPSGQPGQEGLRSQPSDGPFVCTDLVPPPGGVQPPPDPFDPPCSGLECDLVANLDWSGSDIAMIFESPSGRVIDRSTDAPDVIRENGPTFERYRILRAEEGTWSISVVGLDVPPEGERAGLTVSREPSNNSPIAQCQDVTVAAGAQCTADASVDNGSFDPDQNDPLSVLQTPTGPFNLGETMVSLTITDGDGLGDTCQSLVSIVDQSPPEIDCPANMSVPAGVNCEATVSMNSATATDNCDSAVSISSNAPAVFPIGTTVVAFTATDDSGGSSICQTKVEVIDEIPPEITCPSDITLVWPVTPAMIGVPDVSDSCGAIPIVVNDAPDQFSIGQTIVSWSTFDAFGNSATCQQTVTAMPGINGLCPCNGQAGSGGAWRNHGQYVSCVAKASNNLIRQGLINRSERKSIVQEAAQSQCGK